MENRRILLVCVTYDTLCSAGLTVTYTFRILPLKKNESKLCLTLTSILEVLTSYSLSYFMLEVPLYNVFDKTLKAKCSTYMWHEFIGTSNSSNFVSIQNFLHEFFTVFVEFHEGDVTAVTTQQD